MSTPYTLSGDDPEHYIYSETLQSELGLVHQDENTAQSLSVPEEQDWLTLRRRCELCKQRKVSGFAFPRFMSIAYISMGNVIHAVLGRSEGIIALSRQNQESMRSFQPIAA